MVFWLKYFVYLGMSASRLIPVPFVWSIYKTSTNQHSPEWLLRASPGNFQPHCFNAPTTMIIGGIILESFVSSLARFTNRLTIHLSCCNIVSAFHRYLSFRIRHLLIRLRYNDGFVVRCDLVGLVCLQTIFASSCTLYFGIRTCTIMLSTTAVV